MPSPAHATFQANKKEIQILWNMHAEIVGKGNARERRVDILNRAAILLISACWESYVEDAAIEAFDFMLTRARNPSSIPARVRSIASKKLNEDSVWELAGAGWKDVLRSHEQTIKKRWSTDFNTPKSAKVDELFSDLVGIVGVSSAWTWTSVTSEQARDTLDEFMTIRGNIAHRIKHESTVSKEVGTKFLAHVGRLVDLTDKAVCEHLKAVTGSVPWAK